MKLMKGDFLYTPPKFNSSPLKVMLPSGICGNLSGALYVLNFGSVVVFVQ